MEVIELSVWYRQFSIFLFFVFYIFSFSYTLFVTDGQYVFMCVLSPKWLTMSNQSQHTQRDHY